MVRLSGVTTWACLAAAATGAVQTTTEQQLNAKRTLSVGFIIFDGYEPLDVWGPLEIFSSLSYERKMTLSLIAHKAGPISAGPPPGSTSPPMDLSFALRPTILATHSFTDAPALDILLVPGGRGLDALYFKNDTAIQDFVASRYPRLDYLLSVCTGSMALAQSGVLAGKRATTNKRAWSGVTSFGENITWVPSARWVHDDKIWTSSGVSAGIDMTYAFFRHVYGENDEVLATTMNTIEYAPHTDAHWDPFSVVHKVPGADTSRSLEDCVVPVGY